MEDVAIEKTKNPPKAESINGVNQNIRPQKQSPQLGLILKTL